MKKIILLISAIILLTACSKDETDTPATKQIKVDKMQWLRLSADTDNANENTYVWMLNKEVIGTAKELMHVFAKAGTYNLELKTSTNLGVNIKNITVIVNDRAYENGVTKVFDYMPAPGQFVNTLPKANTDDNAESMRKKAEEYLAEGSMISLGGFGGYVVMGFDHTIVNRAGNDFVVLGNAYENSAEPGVIMVSYDANGNGKPDDEWFEIEGSQHPKKGTIKNYEITYYKPESEPTNPDERNYIRWTDNQGKTGYVSKNMVHRQTYFPLWKKGEQILKGTFLVANTYDQSGDGTNWVNPAYDFGYADNWANDHAKAQINIDWAVDKNGNKVTLKGIDFVRVHTANSADAGHLGEVSTEVAGFKDLNL